jgi:hypothetical protein
LAISVLNLVATDDNDSEIMIDTTTITIGLTGDVMIGRNVNTAIANKGYFYSWGNVLSLLKETDINVINLESV